MAVDISPAFQEEIDKVDRSRRLSFSVNPDYGEFEWSYSGLSIQGGTPTACEHGASALLDTMGFRWYAPNPQFQKRPGKIRTDLSAPRQRYWMPANRIWLVYGHNWDGVHANDRLALAKSYDRWATLNAVYSSPYPAGHRWKSIIESNKDFFEKNPEFLFDISGSSKRNILSFNLEKIKGRNYGDLVELCAAQLLTDGLNAFNRTHFDPVDTDPNPSDLVFPFTKAVADRVRAGTRPIGRFNALPGILDAQLGIYAYAGHRLPPAKSVRPSVYTQVALGFNRTQYSYLELVRLHAEKASAIMIREYLDTQAWSNGRPLVNGRTKANYFDRYDAFVRAGVVGANCEFGANWLVNVVMCRVAVRKLRSGSCSYGEALDEILHDVFDNDEAVRQLYLYWSDPFEGYDKWALRRSFDLVARMRPGWYRTYFEQLMVILYEDLTLPDQTPIESQSNDDPYPAALSRLMSHVTAMRQSDITHSYAWVRRKANGAVAKNYPALRYIASPRPTWWEKPALPSEVDFRNAHELLSRDTTRDAELDDEDLVVVQGIVPSAAHAPPTSHFSCEGITRYVFIGPGKLTLTPISKSGDVEERNYGTGIYRIAVAGAYRAHAQGGLVFLDAFPGARAVPHAAGPYWLYVPRRFAGASAILSSLRVRIVDLDGSLDIYDEKDPLYTRPRHIAIGHVAVDTVNTRGFFWTDRANRYLSLDPSAALMPRSIAIAEFPNNVGVKVAAPRRGQDRFSRQEE